ncbi:arsenate reductase [biofilm metagenome]
MATSMTDKTYNILVLCTGNSARSIMAEALFNSLGKGRFKAYSAGSHPTGKVNPFAIEMLTKLDYPIDNVRSKSWDEYAKDNAPKMDFIITVCDNAAGEVCPVWPGSPITVHWGFEDPAAVQGSDAIKRKTFERIFHFIKNRVSLFCQLPLAELDKLAVKREMDKLGHIKDI